MVRTHRAIEAYVFSVRGWIGRGGADQSGCKTISPLIRQQIVLPIQLTHSNTLGVESMHMRHLEIRVLDFEFTAHHGQSLLQRAQHSGLAATSGADCHNTKPHIDRFIQLHHLSCEGFRTPELLPVKALDNRIYKLHIVGLLSINSWK